MSTTITDVDGLQAMGEGLTGDYILGGDIDAAATSTWNLGAGFIPIGFFGTAFTGTFDGKGYTISDLFEYRDGANNCGLFGETDGATISDVTLAGFDITGEDYTGTLIGYCKDTTVSNVIATGVDITGDDYVGGLTGYAGGISTTISDCHTTGSVTGGDDNVGGLIGHVASAGYAISDSYSTATIASGAGGSYVGGFIGQVAGSGTITKCYATGNVTSGGFRLGGFVGQIYAGSLAISKCYSTGNAESTTPSVDVGGFAGYIRETVSVTINDCYAMGSAIGDDDVGGFVGELLSGTITDCYSIGAPSGNTDVGGFCGLNGDTITTSYWDTETSGTETSDGGTGKTTAQMKALVTFTDASWNIAPTTTNRNNGYPFLSWEIDETDTIWKTYGTGVRSYITPDILDGKGRPLKNARVRAYRVDTHAFVEEETTDANGSATFDELPNDVDVVFTPTWGGPRIPRRL